MVKPALFQPHNPAAQNGFIRLLALSAPGRAKAHASHKNGCHAFCVTVPEGAREQPSFSRRGGPCDFIAGF